MLASSHYQKVSKQTTRVNSILVYIIPLSHSSPSYLRIAISNYEEVIKFGDSYEAPQQETTIASASEGSVKKKGRTVAFTTDDIQKRRNDAAILKIFGGNEATKKTKKNLLKQQYGNFKAEAKNNSGNEEVNTASIPTASTQVSSIGPNVATACISLDTACAYMASQSNGSQIKYEDINQIDEDDIEEMDIKECRAPRSQDRGRRDNYKQGSKVEEQAPKALMAIDGKEKDDLDSKLIGFQSASKNLDNLLESQISDKNKEGLGYNVVPPPPAQVYSPLKKDMTWTGLPEFADDTITDYSMPSPAIENNSDDFQNRKPSVAKIGATSSTILSKLAIKFMKSADRPTETKTDKVETAKKTCCKNFEMKNKACFNCGDFNHLSYDCGKWGNSQNNIDDKGYWDSGCSRHMTGNISYLADYEPFDGGYVSFGQRGCKIIGKGTIKTGKLEFENVYFVKDLKTPKQHNMYSINLNNVLPHKDLTYLVAKASADECMLWHRRLCHLNIKTMNRLVRHNLVRGLPSKCFDNDHTCVACLKGKKHKASCKTKLVNSVTKPLHTLHMDLFGPTSVSSLNHKKGIKREFSNARTPQQNRVAERRNKTLIEAARTMLADAKLPVTVWAEAVNTACYVQDRVLVNKSQNKTPYELFNGINSTNFSGSKDAASQDVKKDVSSLRYIALPNWFHEAHLESSTSNAQDACNADAPESSGNFNPTATSTNPLANQMETLRVETPVPTISSPVLTACLDDSPQLSSDSRLISKRVTSQDDTPSLDNILTLPNTDDSNGVEVDLGNMEYNISASPTPTFKIYKDHLKSQIIGPVDTSVQTENKSKEMEEQSFIATIHQKTNPALLQFCLFSWVRPIGTKWVLKNKKDERGIMDVKSTFLYGTIDEEVYVMQPPGFQDPEFPARVYKVEKAMGTIDHTLFIRRKRGDFILVQVYVDDTIFGSSNPQLCREFEALMHEKFQMSAMGELNFFLGLQDLQKKDGIFLSQDKPDIMFAVCACATHQVTPEGSSQTGTLTIVATSTTKAEYVAAASGCGQVLWIQNQLLDYGLSKPWEAQFQGITSSILLLIETTNEETKILATVDGKPRIISESSIRRNLKLRDEAGISSLPDAELFENLTLMGYNILPNQKFSFQNGQFSHQWKYLIHTIMQCLSPKSTGFNEFSSNIATALVCLATNRVYNFSKMIFDGMVRNVNNKVSKFLMYPRVNSPSFSGRTVPLFPLMLVTMGEGSGTLTELHHTPFPEAQQTSHTATSSPSLPYSSALPTTADQSVSPIRDDSQGKACPTVSGLEAAQDRANITKTSTLPSDSTPRVTSFAVDKGTALKARIKHLEDRDGGDDDPFGEDATIKGRRLKTWEEVGIEMSIEKGSDDTEEMVNVLTSFDAASVLSSGVQVCVPPVAKVATVSILPAGETHPISVPTGSGVVSTTSLIFPTGSGEVPTVSPIFTTATVAIPYSRRKEEGERFKRKELRLEQDSAKKTEGQRSYWKIIRLGESTTSYQFFVDMLKHFDREDLNQLWALVKETLNIRQATSNKEKELWVELKRLYEPDVEDQMWTQTQALMHDSIKWRLYDSCGVHHILSRDQEIFMLVEREYPLRKGLAIMEHQVYGRIVRNKMLKAFPLPVMSSHCQKKFPLLVREVPPAEEKRCHC
uniref:Uncharacterized protein n=1 Tax=Tanacetum cinerariifolium TaxID=118510 RepID=A0A6L2LCW7_TANCI|nr:hypothetical protein [Tanacetum cinerariifolium]